MNNRFQDKNFRISHFYKEVWVVCPACKSKAIATVDFDAKQARLLCTHCGYNKDVCTRFGKSGSVQTAADWFFDVELWLTAPFKKNEVVWAYNDKHLAYLKEYISADLREHKDRTGFTLLEKLPRFYHEAKNREALLKVIEKLEKK